MIIAAPQDYREAARRRLPPFLFHYIDGGAYAEQTLQRNTEDLQQIALRQRILQGVGEVDLSARLFDESLRLPIILAPVGLTGMYARRGEVQAARAAAAQGAGFTLSSMAVCSIEEVQAQVEPPIWFQLYVLKDRGFIRHALERAWAAGVRKLVFTVDLPLAGARYRDAHSGLAGPFARLRRLPQILSHPRWAWDVGLRGGPHTLGNVSAYLKRNISLGDFMGWIHSNFDASIGWRDLEWIRQEWRGTLIIKGILDPEDAKDAARFGADGIVVSNHGGRQLDGVPATARVLPAIADAVQGQLTVLADSGIRSGLDVVRMLALGAEGVLIGRAFAYALAADGERGVSHLLQLFAKEMQIAMTLIGARHLGEITRDRLVSTLPI